MTKDYYTLQEAAEWIAFRMDGLPLEHLIKEQQSLENAKMTLFNALQAGRIQVSGVFEEGDGFKDVDNIEVDEHACLDYEENSIDWGGERYFYGIAISIKDLRKEFPPKHENAILNTLTDGYMSPYMRVMFETIREFNITNENQPPKKIMHDFIQARLEHYKVRPSKNIIESIGTLIRLPEAQKGGLKPLSKN